MCGGIAGYKCLGGGCPATSVRGVFAGYDQGGAYVGVGSRRCSVLHDAQQIDSVEQTYLCD